MPVIPTYEPREQLDPDVRGMPHVRFDDSEFRAAEQQGRALQGFGSSLSSALGGLSRQISAPTQDTAPSAGLDAAISPSPALRSGVVPQAPSEAASASPTAAVPDAANPAVLRERAAITARRTTDFSTGLQDDARRQSIQGAFDGAQGTMLPNGAGFVDSFLQTADEIATESFKAMPAGPARDAAIAAWPAERQGWVNKAASAQIAQQKSYSLSQLDTFGKNAVSEVKQNPASMDGVLATGAQRITDAPGLAPGERAVAAQQFSRTVLMAGLGTQYAADPEGLRRALSLDDQGKPLDRVGYDQWRAGLPKDQLDALTKSAQAAHAQDPSVSVDHRLQDAYRATLAPPLATIPGGIAAQPAAGIGSDRTAMGRNPAFSQAVASGRAGQAMDFFLRQGWSQAQAAGIVGNLMHESGGLNTAARNAGDGSDGSDSVGLAQWNGKRARDLNAFAAARGASSTDFGTQLAFVQHELTSSQSGAAAALRQATTTRDAAAAVALKYERPAGSQTGVPENVSGWNNRLRNATALSAGQYPAAGAMGSPNARYSALTQSDVQQLLAGAEAGKQRAIAQADQQRQVDIHATTQAVDDDVANAQATGQSNLNLEPGHVATVLGPAAAQQYSDRLGMAFDVYRKTAGMTSLSNDDLAAEAEQYHPGDDETVPDYARRSAVYFGVHNRAQQILEDRAADPASAVTSDFGVMRASADAMQNSAAYERLAQARLTAQSSLGIPPSAQSPITRDEARAYADHLKPAPGQDQASAADAVVQDINARFGRYANLALAQVMRQQTGRRDVGDVLSAAMLRARSTTSGPLATTAEGSRLTVGQQADAIAATTGAATPSPGQTTSLNNPPARRGSYLDAVDALQKDPSRMLPFFVSRYGVDRVPANLRGRLEQQPQPRMSYGPGSDSADIPMSGL